MRNALFKKKHKIRNTDLKQQKKIRESDKTKKVDKKRGTHAPKNIIILKKLKKMRNTRNKKKTKNVHEK